MLTRPTASFSQARLHGAIKLVVGGVDHHGRSVEQRNFILRLDHAGFGHKLLSIHHFDALALQSEQHWQFDDVDADGFFVQPAHFEFDTNFLRDIFGASHLRRHRTAQHRNSRPRAPVEPRAIQLMMFGGGSEIPQDGLVILRQKREAIGLVLRPGADVRRRQVAHVVHVEAEQRSHLRLGKQVFRFLQTFAAETIEIDPALPVDRHGSVSFECHKNPL